MATEEKAMLPPVTNLPLAADMSEEEERELMLIALERHLVAVEEQLCAISSAEKTRTACAMEQKSTRSKQPARSDDRSERRVKKQSKDRQSTIAGHAEAASRTSTITNSEAKKSSDKRPQLTVAEKEQLEKQKEFNRKKREFQMRLVELFEEVKLDRRDEEFAVLKHHVAKQRELIHKRDVAFAERRRKREDKLQREIDQRPKRNRSSGVDDFDFLRRVPKTSFYQIVAAEQEQLHSGKICSVSQLHDFWKESLVKHGLMKPPPVPVRKARRQGLPEQKTLALSGSVSTLPEEDEEEDEPVNTWAVTGMISEHTSMSSMQTVKSDRSDHSTASLRVLFSKIEPPTFASLQLDLKAKKPSPELIKQREKIQRLTRETNVKKVLVQRMMLLARQHQAHGQSLISMLPNEDNSCAGYFSLPSLTPKTSLMAVQDVPFDDSHRSSLCSPTDTSKTDFHSDQVLYSQSLTPTSGSDRVKSKHIFISEIEAERRPKAKSEQSEEERPRSGLDGKQNSRLSSQHSDARRMEIPLTLESLSAGKPIKESKSRSMFWANYVTT